MPPEISRAAVRIGWANITPATPTNTFALDSDSPSTEGMAFFVKSQILPKANRSLCRNGRVSNSASVTHSQSTENIPSSLPHDGPSLLACLLNNENISSCPSSPSLSRANLSSDSLLPQDLYQKLELCSRKAQQAKTDSSVILLDCRSFTAFSKNHIEGALNVNCTNKFSSRRLRDGKVSLLDLVTSEEGKEIFRKRTEGFKEVVVYDESSQELEQLPATHPTSLVMNCLKKEGTRARLLKGGIQAFGKNYSQMCNTDNNQQINSSFTPCLAFAMRKQVVSNDSPGVENRPPPMEVDSLNAPMAKILPHLFVGGENDAANLCEIQRCGITHILNATNKIPCFHESEKSLRYLRIPVKDNGSENLQVHFERAFQFIEEAKRSGGSVLVHCQAGISRSSTIAIAYIMKYLNLPMRQAYAHVQKCRPIIAPNINFMGQLVKYEKYLNANAMKFKVIQNIKECPSPCGLQAQSSRPGTPVTEFESSLLEA